MTEEVVHHYSFRDYLHWGTRIPHIWFEWWHVEGATVFMVSLVALFLLAFVHESTVLVRRRMIVHTSATHLRTASSIGSASVVRLFEALLSALLILALVSFNAWLILAICLGSATGYYFVMSMEEGASLEPSLH